MLLSCFFSSCRLGGSGARAASAQAAPEGKLPVAITSCGQSPDGFILKMLCDRIKLKVTYNSLLKVDELKDFKSLMVVMGGSAKGLGAAGIDEPQELQRVQSVLAKAKEQKTAVFGLHIGGEARRGQALGPLCRTGRSPVRLSRSSPKTATRMAISRPSPKKSRSR